MPTIIEADNLTVRYGQVEAVKDISFTIIAGDFIGLAGPNGAGKTTMIKALLGLLPINKGKVFLFDKEINNFTEWQKIGYLPQKNSSVNSFFPATAEEIVLLGLLAKKKNPKIFSKEDKNKVKDAMSDLEIYHLKDRMFFDLSGGQQQRVLLSRSLVSDPQILIFDEPSTALDPEAREAFFNFLKKINQERGTTIILITHDTGYVGKYANKLMYIDKSLIYFGSFSDFCHSPKMTSYFSDYGQHLICHQHD